MKNLKSFNEINEAKESFEEWTTAIFDEEVLKKEIKKILKEHSSSTKLKTIDLFENVIDEIGIYFVYEPDDEDDYQVLTISVDKKAKKIKKISAIKYYAGDESERWKSKKIPNTDNIQDDIKEAVKIYITSDVF